MIKETFSIDMFNGLKFILIIGEKKEFNEYVKESFNVETELPMAFCATFNDDIVIGLPLNVDYPMVTHECYHLLHHVAKKLDLSLGFDDQEWGAYMIETFMCKILNILKTIKE